MKVKATKLGFYNNRRQRPGMVFHLTDSKHFSENWMEKVEGKPSKPSKKVEVKKVEEKKPESLDVI